VAVQYHPHIKSPLQNLATIDSGLATLARLQNTKYLLGWNEPDRSDQANIDAVTGATNWYRLEQMAAKYNLKLGGPAIGSRPAWQDEFFQACDNLYCIESFKDIYGRPYGGDGTTCKAAATNGAAACKQCANKPYGQRGCRVDFMPLHLY
jgi:hypothetical protein